MGNRKKIKNNRLRLRAPDVRPAMRAAVGPDSTIDEAAFSQMGLANIDVPSDEAEVIKIVPAKVDGVVVGEALLHDDGSVAIRIDENAPEWAVQKIKSTEAEMMGYNLGLKEE